MTEHRYTLITGASSDIGREIIKNLATPNRTILAHYHTSSKPLADLAKNIPGSLLPVSADLSDEGQVMSLIQKVKEVAGDQLHDLILLAAPKIIPIRLKDLKWGDFQNNLNIQLRSAMLLCQEFLPVMSKAKKGKVVFVLSSVTINIPPPMLSHYVATKYALLGFMKCLASEFATKSISINAISPSLVETAFLKHIPDKVVELSAEQHPLKRNATPADIAPLVAFLVSDSSNYMTGINIPISGGLVF